MSDFGVTQYIGARYVPKFYENSDGTEEWRAGVEYEPLTIVTYNGNSYTSKKPVPSNIGNPSDNTSYWVSTGNYNQQVEAYRQEVQEYKAAVDDITETVEDLDASRSEKTIFIGDSYGNPNYGNWQEKLAQYLGLSSGDYYPWYRDGVSFFDGGFLSIITQQSAALTEEEKNLIGRVVVLGGINDAQTATEEAGWGTITTAISQFCNYVKTNFPHAKIYLGFCGNSVESTGILMGRNSYRIPKAFEAWATCGQYGAEFIPNLEYVLHDYSLMRADGIHPTDAGGEAIAKYAASAINGGGVDVKRRFHITSMGDNYSSIGATSGMTVTFLAPQFGSDHWLDVYQDNAVTNIDFLFRTALAFETPIEFTLGKQLILGDVNCPLWYGKPSVTIPVNGSILTSGGEYMKYQGHLVLNSKTWYLRMDKAGDNWNQHPVVSQVLLEPFTASIPTMLA